MTAPRLTGSRWTWWLTVTACLVSVSTALVFDYMHRVASADPRFERALLHHEIVHGTASSPYRYRVLVPHLLDQFIRHGPDGSPTVASFDSAYRIYYVMAIALILVSLLVVCRLFVSTELAVAAPLLFATTAPIALRDHNFQPWSLLEPVFVSAAIVLAVRGARPMGPVLLTVVATLNRETAFVIPLIFVAVFAHDAWAARRLDLRKSATPVACAAAWVVTFVALRLVLGRTASVDPDVLDMFNRGAGRVEIALRNSMLLLGPVLILCAAALVQRRAPRRLIWIAAVAVPPYLVSVYLYAIWAEVRLLLPLFPILLPLGLAALGRPGGPDGPASPRWAGVEHDHELAHQSPQAPAEVA